MVSRDEPLSLKPNVAKRLVMTFARPSKLPDLNYKIHGLSIVHAVASIRDLRFRLYRETRYFVYTLKIFTVKRLNFSVLSRGFHEICNRTAHWRFSIAPSSDLHSNIIWICYWGGGSNTAAVTMMIEWVRRKRLRPQSSVSSSRPKAVNLSTLGYYPCVKPAQPRGS